MLIRNGCGVSEVRRALSLLGQRSSGHHRHSLWQVSVSQPLGGPCTCIGSVFRPADVTAAFSVVAQRERDFEWQVRALTAGGAAPTVRVRALDEVALYREPTRGSELVTVVTPHDPRMRVLAHYDGMLLVFTADGTTGWILQEECGVADDAYDADASRQHPPGAADIPRFLNEVESYVGCRYLTGGGTSKGIDCSGLIWRAAIAAGLSGVPRHSLDQLRTLTPARRFAPGYLVFIRESRTGPLHVAVVGHNGTCIHASSRRGRVVRDPLSFLRSRAASIAVRSLAGG